jgi:5-methylcytosine-specific restriction endonuclease McrA
MLHAKRFTRFLNLTKDVPKIRGFCAWCGGHSQYGRKYCSQECRDDANIRASGVVVADAVARRDNGICAACGMDCKWLSAEARKIFKITPRYYMDPAFKAQWGPWYSGANYGAIWEADHIIPVSEGGGCCGLDNYRTLCVRCHKLETKELARRIKERRAI